MPSLADCWGARKCVEKWIILKERRRHDIQLGTAIKTTEQPYYKGVFDQAMKRRKDDIDSEEVTKKRKF